MDICLIMDNPETPHHPVIAVALQQLSATHNVRLLDVRPLTGAEAIAEEEKYPLADLYLLKSHAPQALDVAHTLEQKGALVVNSWASSVACQDRVLMAERMHEANLPWPYTWSFPTLASMLSDRQFLASLPFPLIIKSYYSHRGDLVDKVDNIEQLEALAAEWSQEPVVLQEFAAGDGWDIKMWVIDQQIFAARRRTPLEANASKEDFPIAPDELPREWAHIAMEIGRVFNMRLYGVDLLITEHGPMIVDVNGFPGFRGVPGADSALVGLVEHIAQEKKGSSMSGDTSDVNTNLSILDLPNVVTLLYQRANRPLLPGAQKPLGLFVRYLRRKPARGLAVTYAVDELGHADKAHSNDPNRSVSLTLDELALDGARIRFTEAQAQEAPLEMQETGVLRVNDIGLSVQAFPADSSLPALAASCDTTPHSPLFEALQSAARVQLGDDTWQLVSANAVPVRYKPANRCVIRYHLVLEHGKDEGATLRNLTIFGKVYADPEQAGSVQALQQRLYNEQASRAVGAEEAQSREGSLVITRSGSSPLLPRPLGMIESLGLTFNAAVQPSNYNDRLVTGTRALRPQMKRGKGGEITELVIPTEELWLTAIALARLHTSSVRPDESAPRTGTKEAKRARERAALIAGHNPAQADEVRRLAEQLATRLETLQPDVYRPAHGGFKASQLLFHSHQVFVVDFDGFCLADSALDVGYFLAYLRPSGLWYQRPGMMPWFKAAAEVFTTTYRQAMLELGVTQAAIDDILQRSKLYEAALLFKIATRRVNRLNSPRPKELAAMLEEVAACLST